MTVEEFAQATAAIEYVAKGMFYSELYLFLTCCEAARVSCVIESGVRYGMSTRLLAATFPGHIISIDRERTIEPPPRVEFREGDAQVLVPALLKRAKPRDRIGLLLDGPKGKHARPLRILALATRAVRIVALHDQPRRGLGERWHSMAPVFRARAASLDDRIPLRYRRKWPEGHGLAVWGRGR